MILFATKYLLEWMESIVNSELDGFSSYEMCDSEFMALLHSSL